MSGTAESRHECVDPSGTTEEWREIPGEWGYLVSSLGRIKSCHKPGPGAEGRETYRVLSPSTTSRGYVVVSLKGKQRRVNRLVLAAFIGEPPTNLHQAAHWDGDPSNNRLDNLRWATPKENAEDRIRHGTWAHGERVNTCKLTREQVDEIRRRLVSDTRKDLSVEFGVAWSTINCIAKGRSWQA